MMTAIVLINVNRPELNNVINKILEIDGVSEVHAIAGEYDLAAIIRAKDNNVLSEIVADKMPHQVSGIVRTKTLIALKSYTPKA
ncbi:MAG: Lrp/AsnC ligand binding domain-containing protein [Candidatus Nanoarchaeia archaeon]